VQPLAMTRARMSTSVVSAIRVSFLRDMMYH
jgi:hypothetical protein